MLKINEFTPPGVVAWCMGIGAIGQVQEAGAQGMTWGHVPGMFQVWKIMNGYEWFDGF